MRMLGGSDGGRADENFQSTRYPGFDKIAGPLTSMPRKAHQLDHRKTRLCQVIELRMMRLIVGVVVK